MVSRFADFAPFQLTDVRPIQRESCEAGGGNDERPCPWVSCRHHIAVDVLKGGKLREVVDWDDGRETCSLDVAAHGPASLEEIAAVLGVTKQRVQQIEEKALRKMRARGVDLELPPQPGETWNPTMGNE